jgi:hypothetical protein
MAEFDTRVLIWWAVMGCIGVIDLALFVALARWLGRSAPTRRDRLNLLFSGLFVLGTASRCFVLRSDVARFAMLDGLFATVLVGRSIATIAELAFVAQWSLVLFWLAERREDAVLRLFAWPLVPLIALAQSCAWYGVLTTNYIGQTCEESLWAFTAGLFCLGLIRALSGAEPALRTPLKVSIAFCLSYIAFMVFVDIPNYYGLWQAKEQAGASYLTLAEGLVDVQNMTVTRSFESWRYPMVWMTLYFSIAVWASMVLVWGLRGLDRPSTVPDRLS